MSNVVYKINQSINQSDGVRLGRVLLDVAARDELGDVFARTDEEGRAFVQRRGRLREDVVHAVRGGGTARGAEKASGAASKTTRKCGRGFPAHPP